TNEKEQSETEGDETEKGIMTNDLPVQYAYAEEENGQQALIIEADKKQEQASTRDEQAEALEDDELPDVISATKTNDNYILPSLDLLNAPAKSNKQNSKSHIHKTARILEDTFESFNVKAKVTKVHVGPAVTRYEVYPEAGVKVSRIVNLHDDLALA